MIHRTLRAFLTLAVLLGCLGLAAQVSAKPPDLPMPVEDMLTPMPPVTPEAVDGDYPPPGGGPVPQPAADPIDFIELMMPPPPPAMPWEVVPVVPAGYTKPTVTETRHVKRRVPMAVRRNLAACLLFGVHPLLGLTPTDGLVELPEDHPAMYLVIQPELNVQAKEINRLVQVVKDVFLDMEAAESVPSWFAGEGSTFWWPSRDDVLNHRPVLIMPCCPMVKLLRGEWKQVAGEQVFGVVCAAGKCLAERRPEQIKVMPALAPECSSPTVCPWKQAKQQCQREVAQEEVVHDVLTNLKNLMEAEDLLKTAERLRKRGQVTEALDCYEVVSKLCPGSRFDQMAMEAKIEVIAGIYGQAEDTTVAEEQESTPAAKEEPKPDWKAEIRKKLQTTVSVSFDNTPLKSVLDDLRSWQELNIVVDKPALKKLGISLQTPVTLRLDKVTLKSALILVLRSVGLTYVYKDEVLLVTTPRKSAKDSEDCCMGACLGACSGAACQAGIAVQVSGLMKACRLAVESGRHEKAIELAREAYALDPERVAADPLVFKMHVIGCGTNPCQEAKCGMGCGDVEECSDQGCPNGCTKDKCGPNCPEGCCKPCGNDKCKCDKKDGDCCCPKKKCKKGCGETSCPGCEKTCPQGCKPCEPNDADQVKQLRINDLHEQFNSLYKQGKYAEAEAAANEIRKIDPDNDMAGAMIQIARQQISITEYPQTPFIQPDLPPLDYKVVKALDTLEEESEAQETDQPAATGDECNQQCPVVGCLKTCMNAVCCADMKTSVDTLQVRLQFVFDKRQVVTVSYGLGGIGIAVEPVVTTED